MSIQYNVNDDGVIWYENNGVVVSFYSDKSNPDYQRYLRWLKNPDAEEGGTL